VRWPASAPPYLRGERTPDLPNSTGIFKGLTLANFTAPHMARAAFEGVTFGLDYGLARFRELGMHPVETRLTGGGSNNGLWRQMCADVFGVPTVCLQSGEGVGWAGPFKRDGFEAMNRDRVPRWRKSASGSYRQSRPRATNSDALNKTSEIRKAFSEAKLI
jgi:hypothetical protein